MKNYILLLFLFSSCLNATEQKSSIIEEAIIVGAERYELYKNEIQEKSIGLVVNQTSTIKEMHLVDYLVDKGHDVKKIFSPEHGFRGKAEAGELIQDNVDIKTGLPLISLYGKKKKPLPTDLSGIDVMIFDIQDVGVRFYTYLSTLHYVMEACAENDIKLIVLDRPNPNISRIDGPVMEPEFTSFIGLHPVPILYGLSIGEYAMMIKGEKWINRSSDCNLEVIYCDNYKRSSKYNLPIKPSPNLPSDNSIFLYPSLCFFEGTSFSVGRGTDFPFEVYGHPLYDGEYSFTPQPNFGSKSPKHKGEKCIGHDLRNFSETNKQIDYSYMLNAYNYAVENNIEFFNSNNFINLLAGTDKLQQMIKAGKSEFDIRNAFENDLSAFKVMREKYLFYK